MSWYNPTSWFVDKENVEAGAAADAKLDALNAQDYGRGGRIYEKIEADQGTAAANSTLEEVLNNAASDATASSIEAAQEDVNEAFVTGWNEAYDKRTSQAKSVIGAPFKVLWDSLPWYVWLLAGLALFIYLGGGQVARKYVGKL